MKLTGERFSSAHIVELYRGSLNQTVCTTNNTFLYFLFTRICYFEPFLSHRPFFALFNSVVLTPMNPISVTELLASNYFLACRSRNTDMKLCTSMEQESIYLKVKPLVSCTIL